VASSRASIFGMESSPPTFADAAQAYIDSCARRLAARGFSVGPGPMGTVVAQRTRFEPTKLGMVARVVVLSYRPQMDPMELNQFCRWCRAIGSDLTGGKGLFQAYWVTSVAVLDRPTPDVIALATHQPPTQFGGMERVAVRDLSTAPTWFFRGTATIGWAYAGGTRKFIEETLG
jgi:hypothetical protein